MNLIEKLAAKNGPDKKLSTYIRGAHTGVSGAYGAAGGGFIGHLLGKGAKTKAGRIAATAAGVLGGGAAGVGLAKSHRRIGRALYEKPGK
ncbi:hypothetical protein LCGC14_0516440 [marine sediment metagenome]|uniref:Uncharacterized protein n=1 Tax=marine sediment metagenome TaxID=412755 RepID=A0A0F9UL99_9ZZZZ